MKENHKKPVLVNSRSGLLSLVDRINSQSFIGVDSESNSLFAYNEKVCLIQITDSEADNLIDTLAVNDISPLNEIFENTSIQKVFHAAEYDIITLKHDFGFEFNNLFDTMIAARILGYERVGLGSIIENFFGIKLNKKFQKADWGKRPLSDEMQIYAGMDSHYLIDIRDKLYSELKEKERLELANEDFKRLTDLEKRTDNIGNTDLWKLRGARDLSPKQAALLFHLAEYRRKKAEQWDRPLFKIISDDTLLAVSRNQPKTINDLHDIPELSKKLIDKHGSGLIHAVEKGLKDKPAFPPPLLRKPEKEFLLLEELSKWRKNLARTLDLESDVILPRTIMEIIAREAPQNTSELKELMKTVPWRFAKYAEDILKLIN